MGKVCEGPTLSHVLHFVVRQEGEESAGEGQPQRPGLGRMAAATHARIHVEAAQHVHKVQGEHQLLPYMERKREREGEKKMEGLLLSSAINPSGIPTPWSQTSAVSSKHNHRLQIHGE